MTSLFLYIENQLNILKTPSDDNIITQIANTKFDLWDLYNADDVFYDEYAQNAAFTLDIQAFDGDEVEFNQQKAMLNYFLQPLITPPMSHINETDNMRVLMYLLNINNIHHRVFMTIIENVENAPDNSSFIQDLIHIVEDEKGKNVTPDQVKIATIEFLLQRYLQRGLLDMDCEAVFKNQFNTIGDTSPSSSIYLRLIK